MVEAPQDAGDVVGCRPGKTSVSAGEQRIAVEVTYGNALAPEEELSRMQVSVQGNDLHVRG